jgi:hypothetical protein
MLLALQNIVCLVSLFLAKNFRAITFREFNTEEARKCLLPASDLALTKQGFPSPSSSSS